MSEPWLLPGATKDKQTVNARWDPVAQQLIAGVQVKEILNVPKTNGYLTEMFRADWNLGQQVAQVFQAILHPGAISAWHAHATTTDRLFVAYGLMRVVLYDGREGSPTHGVVNDFRFGTIRPALILVPPRVWHGVMNVADTPGIVLNLPDQAYSYEDPDHWRIPADSPEIPVQF